MGQWKKVLTTTQPQNTKLACTMDRCYNQLSLSAEHDSAAFTQFSWA